MVIPFNYGNQNGPSLDSGPGGGFPIAGVLRTLSETVIGPVAKNTPLLPLTGHTFTVAAKADADNISPATTVETPIINLFIVFLPGQIISPCEIKIFTLLNKLRFTQFSAKRYLTGQEILFDRVNLIFLRPF